MDLSTKLFIPSTVVTIESNAISGLSSIEKIYYMKY